MPMGSSLVDNKIVVRTATVFLVGRLIVRADKVFHLFGIDYFIISAFGLDSEVTFKQQFITHFIQIMPENFHHFRIIFAYGARYEVGVIFGIKLNRSADFTQNILTGGFFSLFHGGVS